MISGPPAPIRYYQRQFVWSSSVIIGLSLKIVKRAENTWFSFINCSSLIIVRIMCSWVVYSLSVQRRVFVNCYSILGESLPTQSFISRLTVLSGPGSIEQVSWYSKSVITSCFNFIHLILMFLTIWVIDIILIIISSFFFFSTEAENFIGCGCNNLWIDFWDF